MFIIEKQGLEQKELLAQITAYHTAKVLNISTKNVVLEFTDLGHENWGVVLSPDDLHFIEVNKDNGVTKIIETVCHELRHVWQAQNGWEFDYTLPYMEQAHEIDAWKFMDDFVSEYKDIIYGEYLDKKKLLDTDIGDWENYIIPPPEYLETDLSEMVGLSYTKNQNTTKKESIKMAKQFTEKQLNKAGLVASESIKEIVAKEKITTIKGLKALREELELDNRGKARINFNGVEMIAELLADKILKGEVEGVELPTEVTQEELTKSLLDFRTKTLKAKKYLLDADSFVVYCSKEQMVAVVKYAVTLSTRYEKNMEGITLYVERKGCHSADEVEKIVRYIATNNDEKMRTINMCNILTLPVKPLYEEAVAKVVTESTKTAEEAMAESIETAIEVGVSDENIIKRIEELEEFVLGETPAADESPVAEETNTEKEADEEMISMKEHMDMLTTFKSEMNKIMDTYEDTIAKLEKIIEEQAVTISEFDDSDEVAKLRAELDKINSLRKADAKRIEKLENEMGRARLQLREHKVRKLSENKVFELPEKDVTIGVKARINTAAKIDNAALEIHEKSPEKIAAVANKTKDGVQWVADKTKGGIDLTAKGTNVVTEVLANSMIYVADKIAPTDEKVAESVFKKNGEEEVLVLDGITYRYGADGKLIY